MNFGLGLSKWNPLNFGSSFGSLFPGHCHSKTYHVFYIQYLSCLHLQLRLDQCQCHHRLLTHMVLWQYTAGRPPLSQPSKLFMAIRSSSGFSHLRPGVFHISLRTHNPQPRGWKKKKNKQSRAWVSSKRKKGEVCDTFLAFCASVS